MRASSFAVSTLTVHMETDNNDNKARIASLYRALTMHDPEKILSVPEEDEENISTRDAIRQEMADLIETTKTLTLLSSKTTG